MTYLVCQNVCHNKWREDDAQVDEKDHLKKSQFEPIKHKEKILRVDGQR